VFRILDFRKNSDFQKQKVSERVVRKRGGPVCPVLQKMHATQELVLSGGVPVCRILRILPVKHRLYRYNIGSMATLGGRAEPAKTGQLTFAKLLPKLCEVPACSAFLSPIMASMV
jgi:hypothetical protein